MPDIFVSRPSVPEIPASPSDGGNSKKTDPKSGFNFRRQFFSAYHFMPDGIRFETQAPGESIILLLRRHWITNFVWIATGILLIIIPVILFPVIAVSGIIPSNFPGSFISLVILVWYLAIFSYVLVNFLLWYFTVSIVTNERIVDIDFINILHKKFAATRIGKVEDVTMRRGGFIRVLFDYGDVVIQTAAKEHMFLFDAVPHPEKVVRIVNELMDRR